MYREGTELMFRRKWKRSPLHILSYSSASEVSLATSINGPGISYDLSYTFWQGMIGIPPSISKLYRTPPVSFYNTKEMIESQLKRRERRISMYEVYRAMYCFLNDCKRRKDSSKQCAASGVARIVDECYNDIKECFKRCFNNEEIAEVFTDLLFDFVRTSGIWGTPYFVFDGTTAFFVFVL